MQKVIFVIGANAAGKTYFIEHHLASEKAVVLNIYDSFTNCYKRTADAGGKNNMAENQSRAGKPFGEIMMKNSPICMAPRELAEVCQKKKFVVLVSRNDKENSEYAAEVWRDCF